MRTLRLLDTDFDPKCHCGPRSRRAIYGNEIIRGALAQTQLTKNKRPLTHPVAIFQL